MNLRGTTTLFYKETRRFSVVILQTLVAPVITALLYLFIFAHVMRDRPTGFAGVSYAAFLVPGLMMMSMLQNAFANTSSSLIFSKVTGSLVFALLAPLSAFEFFAAYVGAAVVRAMLVGAGVYVAALAYVGVPVMHPGWLLLFGLVGSVTLGALGLLVGLWADKFDQVASFQNFVILPLSFLSGVFYSVQTLPPAWRLASHFNPFFYLIDGFRYGFFGVSDAPPLLSLAALCGLCGALCILALVLLARGYKLRN